jgi:hypothetical protein
MNEILESSEPCNSLGRRGFSRKNNGLNMRRRVETWFLGPYYRSNENIYFSGCEISEAILGRSYQGAHGERSVGQEIGHLLFMDDVPNVLVLYKGGVIDFNTIPS